MKSVVNHQLFVKFSFIIGLVLCQLHVFAQNSRTTILSVGTSYLTEVNTFAYGLHGVEASAEFLFNDEKMGLRLPINLYFEDDLYLGGGANLKFYLNQGKFRAFVGPEFAAGSRITNKYPEDLVTETRYLQVLADAGVAFQTGRIAIALHAGIGREFKHKYFTTNTGLTIGFRF